MKISELYKEIIKAGSQCDPRGRRIALYPDTAILYGKPHTKVKKILVGIDIETADLLLAERIRQKEGLDLVISHHPEGRAFASLFEVMRLQVDLLVKIGVLRSVAEGLLEERMQEVERKIMAGNHMRSVDAARIMDIPFMCVHTPADNQVASFLKSLFLKKKPKTVQDMIGILDEVPEYRIAKEQLNNGPKILLGSPKRLTGKILFEMTGGTEGNKDIYDKLSKTGIRTILGMHLSEEHFKKVKDANLNAIIAGHISSDTLGLNLLLDKIEKKAGETFKVINCSGFIRIKRK